jgi:hypothetical protein
VHILVELEGVLKGPRNDEPILVGIQMVGALSSYNQISFLTEMSTLEAKQWVDVNKIVDYDNLLDASLHLEGDDLTERQIKHARSRGKVDMFITGNPEHWVVAFEQGLPSIMFGVPSYIRPEFRPDAPKRVRSWDEITKAIAKQNEQRTQDRRLTRGEGTNFD